MVVHVIVPKENNLVALLAAKRIASVYQEGAFAVIARYGVNKTTLKKIMKRSVNDEISSRVSGKRHKR